MIKSQTIIEIKIGERNYTFECSPDSPLGEIHDALFQMKSIIVQQIVQEHEKEKSKQNPEEEKCLQ